MRYYQTANAARPVTAGARTFLFAATEFLNATNSTWGTLATEDPEEIAALDALVAAGKIYAIDAADYARGEVKKKSLGISPSLIGLKNWHAPQMGASEPPAAAPVAAAEPETVEEALVVKTAKPRAKK